MRLIVRLNDIDAAPVLFEADRIQKEVDGDGELKVIVNGQDAAVFARGCWMYAADPAVISMEPAGRGEGNSLP